MSLGVSNSEGNMALTNEVVRAEEAGSNFRLHYRESNLRYVYTYGEDGGIKQLPTVVGLRTRPPPHA